MVYCDVSGDPPSIMFVSFFHEKYLSSNTCPLTLCAGEAPDEKWTDWDHIIIHNGLSYTLERRAYFFKCFTISSATLASHSNKCPPLCWYNMTSYSTRPWETNTNTGRDGHKLLFNVAAIFLLYAMILIQHGRHFFTVRHDTDTTWLPFFLLYAMILIQHGRHFFYCTPWYWYNMAAIFLLYAMILIQHGRHFFTVCHDTDTTCCDQQEKAPWYHLKISKLVLTFNWTFQWSSDWNWNWLNSETLERLTTPLYGGLTWCFTHALSQDYGLLTCIQIEEVDVDIKQLRETNLNIEHHGVHCYYFRSWENITGH